MSKPLAGKRWFYALGQSDRMKGLLNPRKAYRSQVPGYLPDWAKSAYIRGWFQI